jgi:hypothetical protein
VKWGSIAQTSGHSSSLTSKHVCSCADRAMYWLTVSDSLFYLGMDDGRVSAQVRRVWDCRCSQVMQSVRDATVKGTGYVLVCTERRTGQCERRALIGCDNVNANRRRVPIYVVACSRRRQRCSSPSQRAHRKQAAVQSSRAAVRPSFFRRVALSPDFSLSLFVSLSLPRSPSYRPPCSVVRQP